MNQRNQLRQVIKAKRKALSVVERQEKSAKIAQRIINSDLFKASQRVACYIAKGAEVNLQEVIAATLALGKHCYLPLIRQDKSELFFIEYLAGDDLQVGSFEILEPKFDKHKLIAPEDLDLVLAPLVAFDANGNRLGRGGGYYDRTFAFLKQQNKPIFLGVAYACQKVLKIENRSHDVRLHGVITEQEYRIF